MDNETTDNSTQAGQPQTLAEKLTELQQEWTKTVSDLNNDMKTLPTLDKLLNVIYTKRQEAVDLYSNMLKVLNNQLRQYKQKYAKIYDTFKLGTNGIRYSTESSIQTQCEAALTNEKAVIDDVKTFADFMWETIKTIDNMIYGVSHKMKIYEIQNGIKF